MIINITCISETCAQNIWMSTYGGDLLDHAMSVQQTSDGGYIVAGGTYSLGHGSQDIWLLRLDDSGDTIWTKTFGGIDDDKAYYVQQTTDNGFIITGYTKSFGSPGDNVFLIKTDSSGNHLWRYVLSDSNRSWSLCVRQTKDPGYVLTGFTQIFGENKYNAWLIRSNEQGIPIWSRNYNWENNNWVGSVYQTNEGGFILAGFTEINDSRDGLIIMTDSVGDTIWTKTYGGIEDDWFRDIQPAPDGGYILTGVSQSGTAGGQDIWLVKTDSSGKPVFEKKFGGLLDDWAYSIDVLNNDLGYVITGGTNSFGSGDTDAWVIKTDLAGDTLWTHTYGGIDTDVASSVKNTIDNGFVIAGGTSSFGAGDSDVWIFKTDSAGNTQLPPSGIYGEDAPPHNYFLSQNYPNPFNGSTRIDYRLPESNFVIIKIFDLLGREIETLVNEYQQANNYTLYFNAKKLNSGVYFYSLITSDGYTFTKKMIYLK